MLPLVPHNTDDLQNGLKDFTNKSVFIKKNECVDYPLLVGE
jgi:hypothetical protein